MHAEYQKHTAASNVPAAFESDLTFLVAGFGETEDCGSVFRLSVKNNKCDREFPPDELGLSWSGQANYVERIINGVDSTIKWSIRREVQINAQALLQETMTAVMDALTAAGVGLPQNFAVTLPTLPGELKGWNAVSLGISLSHMPAQYAVDLVSFLVNAQSGMQRFTRGVATVGGRTHVGYIRRAHNLHMLSEPEVSHRFTGFSNDD